MPLKVSVPAPLVGAALSGLVVGIMVTLVATGVMTHATTGTPPPATLPPPTSVADPQMYTRVSKLIRVALGPSYPAHPGSRLLSLSLDPAAPQSPSFPPVEGYERFRSVTAVFRLNDHPLGRSWRFRAARADVFAVLKTLYTSQMPIFDIYLEGRYPVKDGKVYRSETVLIAYMSHGLARTIPWRRWGRDKEAALWTLLPYKYVDPRFS